MNGKIYSFNYSVFKLNIFVTTYLVIAAVIYCFYSFEGISKLLHTVSDLITVEPGDCTEEVVTLTDDRTYNSQHYSRKQVSNEL